MAPSVSPNSIALDVPTAWEHAPMEIPAIIGSFTRKSLISVGAKMLPRMPVKITATTVMGTIPPCPSATLTAMGVVTDFGMSETVIASSMPNSLHISSTLPIDARDPQDAPTTMGSQFFFNSSARV